MRNPFSSSLYTVESDSCHGKSIFHTQKINSSYSSVTCLKVYGKFVLFNDVIICMRVIYIRQKCTANMTHRMLVRVSEKETNE